jgi:hypothetical protein
VAVELLKSLPGAQKRIALGVDQVLDLQCKFNIVTTVKPLASSTFIGF